MLDGMLAEHFIILFFFFYFKTSWQQIISADLCTR